MASQLIGNTAAGTISVVVGNVRIIGVDGVARVAKVGDKILAREVIETGADGIVQVQLQSGRFVELGPKQPVLQPVQHAVDLAGP